MTPLMPLAPGSHLGPYEILGPLGSGGMGEVYRARDTRLERTVAIKILPAQFSSDPARRQRFEREARAISSLNHPHICMLFDVGRQEGVDYLVMEFVEGETLGQRLARGPLPIDQVLKLGAQIAAALERAHRSGIVHRDLKPGNIMLTPGGAKLLDFGLAKPAIPATLDDALTAAAGPAGPMTEEGAIVGTFEYMSPEQVEGKDVDARSDIFSLGAVLYEMLTGKRAFEGRNRISVASAILEREPAPIQMLKPLLPAALEHAVGRCLAKIPEERWQSAGDLAGELKWISQSGPSGGAPERLPAGPGRRGRLGWVLAALLSLVVLGGGGTWWVGAHRPRRPMYFSSSFPYPAKNVALSPDGRVLAMVASGDQATKDMIWTQEIGGRTSTPLPGTEDASHPFWSPDGRSIAFFAQGKLKKVDLRGGTAQVLCDAPHGRGGAWSRDGTILFSPEAFGGLYKVPLAGGAPVKVTEVDPTRFESSHRWPGFLPDGRHFLYLAANFSGQFDKNAIFLGSLDSPEKRQLVSASSNAVYADPGYLLYVRDNVLLADRFDPRTYRLAGEPRTISDGVQESPQIDLALFDVAGPETLVSQTGAGAARSQLTWFDRNGKPAGVVGSPGLFANPGLSQDGRRVAVDQIDRDGRHVNIWIYELGNDAVSRFTFGSSLDQLPIWSPDGRQIVYASNKKLRFCLYQKNADGSGSEEQIGDLGVPLAGFWDWSRDGRYQLLRKNAELWLMTASDHRVRPFLQTQGIIQNARFSPDGKWVAYSANETGSWEIYITPFPGAGSKWQVSRGGGQEPRWRGDGKELFYLSGQGRMTAVPMRTGGNLEAGAPVALFQTHPRLPVSSMDVFSYDVTADGQRFLINTKIDEPNAAPVSIILNWASELER